MNTFLIVVVLLTCATLLCVLPPLLRQAPAEGETGARQTVMALLLALGLPAVATLVYLQVGSPAALTLSTQASGGEHQTGPREMVAMVQGLSERLREQPGDPDGWYMLARSYTVLGRHHDAAAAYSRLVKLVPDDPAVLADYADARATANGGSLQGEPARLIEQTLTLDPHNVKALALSGSAAFEAGQYGRAIVQWQAALARAPGDSPFAQSIRASIAEATMRVGGATAPGAAPAAAAAAGPLVALTVSLAPELAARASFDDVVFVSARAADGAPMPIAVRRARVADLPLQVTLADSDSMAGARLSAQREVVLAARISKSGSATPAPGDYRSAPLRVSLPARAAELKIDQIQQ